MKRYIFGSRNGIYIIDLQQTLKKFREAYEFIRSTTARGDKVLFVGTKKQAQVDELHHDQEKLRPAAGI